MTQVLQSVGHLCSQWFCKTKQWQSYLFHKGGYQLDLSTHDFPNQLLARLCKRDRVFSTNSHLHRHIQGRNF